MAAVHKYSIWKRAILSLFLAFSFSCQKKTPNFWKYQTTQGQESKYSSSYLTTKNNFNNENSLYLELIKTETAFNMYLTIPPLSLSSETNSNPIKITLSFGESSEIQEVFADKLEGQQKLLLSSETRDLIIQTLLNKHDVMLHLGSYKMLLSSDKFPEIYQSLVAQ